jgi:hypothetical protein
MDYATHRQIAEEAYNDTPADSIGDYRLVHNTPTLKAYRNDNNMIIGVRGTYDMRDVKADAALAAGRLRYTQRFKDDSDALKQVLNRYHGNVTTASHSLGGAIADELGNDHTDRIIGGIAFNPAYDPVQLVSGGRRDIHRFYARNDPLSKLGGRTLHNVHWVDSGARNPIAAHRLDNF